jgi:hypothetical protein
LSAGNAEEGVHFRRRRRRSIMRRGARTWRSRRSLGLILTPRGANTGPLWRSRQQGYHSWACGLVLTAARTATTSLLHWSTDV